MTKSVDCNVNKTFKNKFNTYKKAKTPKELE